MHFWRKEYFKTLKDAAAAARAVPEWKAYAEFCEQYERGLRREAFLVLERFISFLEGSPVMARRSFVSWLSHQADGCEGRHMLVPYPLQVRIVEPTLVEWAEVEPDCSEPHLWLGGYEHLKRAVELAPHDHIAKRTLIGTILNRVGFDAHELPAGYLGDAVVDLAALNEAEMLLASCSSEEPGGLAAEIVELRERIKHHLRATGL